MKQKGCFYCEKSNDFDKILVEICDLMISTVFIEREQTYKGRCSVMFRHHYKELFQLTPDELSVYMQDVACVARVLDELFHPDKINYAVIGDIINHVHFNLVPKYRDSPNWGEPYDNDPLEKHFMTQEETRKRAGAILEKLKETGRVTKVVFGQDQS